MNEKEKLAYNSMIKILGKVYTFLKEKQELIEFTETLETNYEGLIFVGAIEIYKKEIEPNEATRIEEFDPSKELSLQDRIYTLEGKISELESKIGVLIEND